MSNRYVPPQHGAWAFLGLPLALGFVVAPWTPLLLVLGVAWVVAYPWSYAALSLVRARRKQRFRKPFAVWLAVLLPAVVVLLVWVYYSSQIVLLGAEFTRVYTQREQRRKPQLEEFATRDPDAAKKATKPVGAG